MNADIICWILLGIGSFYLLRNFIVGNILYPVAHIVIQYTAQAAGYHKQLELNFFSLRNYYIFVLNPFWWRVSDTLKNKDARKMVRKHRKNVKKFKKN